MLSDLQCTKANINNFYAKQYCGFPWVIRHWRMHDRSIRSLQPIHRWHCLTQMTQPQLLLDWWLSAKPPATHSPLRHARLHRPIAYLSAPLICTGQSLTCSPFISQYFSSHLRNHDERSDRCTDIYLESVVDEAKGSGPCPRVHFQLDREQSPMAWLVCSLPPCLLLPDAVQVNLIDIFVY